LHRNDLYSRVTNFTNFALKDLPASPEPALLNPVNPVSKKMQYFTKQLYVMILQVECYC
jgi:hypothetical protein